MIRCAEPDLKRAVIPPERLEQQADTAETSTSHSRSRASGKQVPAPIQPLTAKVHTMCSAPVRNRPLDEFPTQDILVYNYFVYNYT